jgi:hypothetical protein
MFWNDPNLYSVAFKDTPNFPAPFYGTIPRFLHPYPTYLTPPITPQMFNPQVPPTYFTPPMYNPQVPPAYFTPQAPYLHTPPVAPFMPPMMTPYNFTLPYFDRYRPLAF